MPVGLEREDERISALSNWMLACLNRNTKDHLHSAWQYGFAGILSIPVLSD